MGEALTGNSNHGKVCQEPGGCGVPQCPQPLQGTRTMHIPTSASLKAHQIMLPSIF